MYEELAIALDGVVTPERQECLLYSYQVQSDIGAPTLSDELQQILGMQDGESDDDLLVGRIESLMTVSAVDMLAQYNIYLNDQADLRVITAVLDTVGRLEYFVIPSAVLDILFSELDNEEKLARIVTLLNTGDESWLVECFEEINDTVIARMTALFEELVDDETVPDATVPLLKQRVQLINSLLRQVRQEYGENATLLVMGLSRQGVPIGQPWQQQINQYLSEIEEYPLEERSVELLGLLIYTDVDLSEILSRYQSVLELLDVNYRDHDTLMRGGRHWWERIQHG